MPRVDEHAQTGKRQNTTIEADFKLHYRNIRMAILNAAGQDVITYRRDIWKAAYNRIQRPPFNYALNDLTKLQDEVDAEIERELFGDVK